MAVVVPVPERALDAVGAVAGAPPVARLRGRVAWVRRHALGLAALALTLPLAWGTIPATVDWLGRPFPGFFVMQNGLVPTVGLYTWTGIGGGVPFHARVVAVDGVPFAGNGALYDHVAGLPVGTPVRYEFAKEGHAFAATVPTMVFGARDYWLTVGVMAFFGVASAAAGIIVVLLQPGRRAAHAFLAQGVLNGLFALTGTALYRPGPAWMTALHLLLQAAYPAAFIQLALTFPVERRFVVRRPALLAAPYALAGALGVWSIAGFFAAEPSTTPLYVSYVWVSLGLAVLIGLFAYAYWENRRPAVRVQLRVVFPGLVLGSAAALYGFLDNARSGGNFPINLVALTPLLFFLSVGWAIVRHDLFDIDALVRQAVLYATLTLGITAAYAATVAVCGQLSLHALPASPLFNVAFIVLVAVGVAPLRARIQHAIDRTFFRSRPDYRRTVGDVSAALTALLDLDEILARVGRTVMDGLQLRSLAVVLWLDDGTRVWRCTEGRDLLLPVAAPPCDELRLLLDRAPREARHFGPEAAGDGSAVRAAAALGAVLLLPLTVRDSVIGAFALGPRRSGVPFTSSDLELLHTLAAQSAIAIQNALSYQALRTLNAELELRVRARTAALESSNTELDRALKELRSTQAQLLQSEKLASLGQLVAGVAHEINNPVSFIVGNVEPLKEELGTVRALAERHDDATLVAAAERVARMFEIIARGADRTAAIVNDLRIFSRPADARPGPTDVHEALDMSVRLLKPKWTGRVEIHRDFGTLPPVAASPGQLNQVFMNVLANACDAIEGKGHVWIGTACDRRQVTVTIRDDGVGIPADYLDRIFDPFFTTKPPGKGTGLGLAISYGIVTQHGGTLRAVSAPGAGTTFTIVLPVGGAPASAPASA